ncbi:hypothetical protein [Candidatus Deianiraea vastatrix]|uniref:Uncharacterized protein n=1 Tax=Candidatus Deianiraea vastatrix TaxID=2163644 RepID=A0A5B8XFY2_9RICK|nr:hypothetical protein [Candidatus Deianiraea vastatrix]QED23254.1 hypothetical protein Deia_00454 [Candidatus Deianiraea vastatrix]
MDNNGYDDEEVEIDQFQQRQEFSDISSILNLDQADEIVYQNNRNGSIESAFKLYYNRYLGGDTEYTKEMYTRFFTDENNSHVVLKVLRQDVFYKTRNELKDQLYKTKTETKNNGTHLQHLKKFEGVKNMR